MAKSKNNKNIIYGLLAILVIAVITIFGDKIQSDNINNLVEQVASNYEITNTVENSTTSDNARIEDGKNIIIRYLDVGQADSILIKSDEKNMLIDAGTNEMGKTVVKDLKDYGVQKIDYLIGTHPHEDHIGGMDDVINSFDIDTIYMPKVQTNTKTFEDVLDAISNKGLKITSPEIGYKFMLGNATCEIMSCGNGNETNNLNLSSIVIRMTYGEQSFLFMGDAEEENEAARSWPQTNVMKIGHHGSNTSTSQSFLNQVKPEVAIISVGVANKYGHPKQTTLDKLEIMQAKIYRTDENGTITITCDGKNNIIETEK